MMTTTTTTDQYYLIQLNGSLGEDHSARVSLALISVSIFKYPNGTSENKRDVERDRHLSVCLFACSPVYLAAL